MMRMMASLVMAWLILVSNGLATDKRPLILPESPAEIPIPRPFELVKFTLSDGSKDVLVDLHFQFVTVQGEIAKTQAVQQALDTAFAPKALEKGGVLPPDRAKELLRVCQNQPQVKVFADPRIQLPIGRSGRVSMSEEVDVADSDSPAINRTNVQTAVDAAKPDMLRLLVEIERIHIAPPPVGNRGSGIQIRKQATSVELPPGHTFVVRCSNGQPAFHNPNVTREQLLLLTATLAEAKP